MAKVKTNAKEVFRLQFGAVRRAVKLNQQTIPKLLQKEILDSISKGKSPVRGEGRYKKYSDGYIKQIKRGRELFGSKKQSPVNLKLTGKMLRSFFKRILPKGFEIGFNSEIAFFHQNGEGNLPVRKLLPGPTDRGFNILIERKITALIKRNLVKAFRSRTRQSRR